MVAGLKQWSQSCLLLYHAAWFSDIEIACSVYYAVVGFQKIYFQSSDSFLFQYDCDFEVIYFLPGVARSKGGVIQFKKIYFKFKAEIALPGGLTPG